jgi:magnesium transporter
MAKIEKFGQPPGTLTYIGEERKGDLIITVLDYNPKEVREEVIPLDQVDRLREYLARQTVTWINVDGLHDTAAIARIGSIFGIHDLLLEDLVRTDMRPKIELYEGHAFMIVKMLNYDERRDAFESEQMTLILGPNYVLTFQEEPGDTFGNLRERIRKRLQICGRGPDYLAYSLIDLVVDTYFLVIERMGEWIEQMEQEILRKPSRRRMLEINELKKDLRFLRKNIWPMRDIVLAMQRHDEGLFSKGTETYLNDLYDHVIDVIESIEIHRDMISNLMELYHSQLGVRMNEIMKTLTVVTSIFIPLTFIVGIYGMNFHYMPELDYKYGYFITLSVMAMIAGGMIYYFRRRGWF